MKELARIQKNLKCPKGNKKQGLSFSYRTCSDILEAFKEVSEGCQIVLTDKLAETGGRVFVVATATITNAQGESESTTACAELGEFRGMNASQATGAASSYARKYALNGLLAIDDTADADDVAAMEAAQVPAQTQTKRKIADDNIHELMSWMIDNGKNFAWAEAKYDLTKSQKETIKKEIL